MLVEFLVVISIISLLIAMLLPALQAARSAVCLAQLRQCGTAFFSYGTDNKMVIPGPLQDGWNGNIPGWNVNPRWWHFYNGRNSSYVYLPYDGSNINKTVVRCPNMIRGGTYGVRSRISSMVRSGDYSAVAGHNATGTEVWFHGIHLDRIERPADYLIAIDTSSNRNDGMPNRPFEMGSYGFYTDRTNASSNINEEAVWMAHGRANGVFADGHAEACDGERLLRTSNANRNTPTQTGVSVWKDKVGNLN
jgi:prepilin-type processing-associated H-X9-DG protein